MKIQPEQEVSKHKRNKENIKTTQTENRKDVSSQVERLVRRFPEYTPYKGFYDLRNYDMPIKMFRKLWRIQDMLFEMNQDKEYYKKWHPAQWQKAQLLSADYQRILFSYA